MESQLDSDGRARKQSGSDPALQKNAQDLHGVDLGFQIGNQEVHTRADCPGAPSLRSSKVLRIEEPTNSKYFFVKVPSMLHLPHEEGELRLKQMYKIKFSASYAETRKIYRMRKELVPRREMHSSSSLI